MVATRQHRMAEVVELHQHGFDAEPAAGTGGRTVKGRDARQVGGCVSREWQGALGLAAFKRDTTIRALFALAIEQSIPGPSEHFERLARERGFSLPNLLDDALDWLNAGHACPPRTFGLTS